MSADALLLDTPFLITGVDHKKYDRVSRISGERDDLKFTLDINCELYPCSVGENIQFSIASTLSLDGAKDSDVKGGWRENRGEASLADTYDYVCYGKVYRFEEGSGELIKVYASFGGLLLYIEGPHKRLSALRHEYIYLLIKK
ncbi:DNA-directed RNA polymerases I, II, and III subunit RPABC3 [Rhizina undulata]